MLQLKRTCNWNLSNSFVLIILIMSIQIEGRPHNAQNSHIKSLSALRSSKPINFIDVRGSGARNNVNADKSSYTDTNRRIKRQPRNKWIDCSDHRNKRNRRCIGKRGVQFPSDDYLDYDYATDYELQHKPTDYSAFPAYDDDNYDENIRPENNFARFHEKPVNDEDYINRTISKCQQSGSTYCEDEYPPEYANYVEKVLQRESKTYEKIFIGKTKHPLAATKDNDTLDVAQRFDGGNRRSGYEITVCSSRKTVIYPKAALSVDSHWSSVINQKDYRQPVNIELCDQQNMVLMDSGQRLIAKLLPNGYTAECKQKFQTSALLSLEHGSMRMNYFKLPSHCELVLFRKFT